MEHIEIPCGACYTEIPCLVEHKIIQIPCGAYLDTMWSICRYHVAHIEIPRGQLFHETVCHHRRVMSRKDHAIKYSLHRVHRSGVN